MFKVNYFALLAFLCSMVLIYCGVTETQFNIPYTEKTMLLSVVYYLCIYSMGSAWLKKDSFVKALPLAIFYAIGGTLILIFVKKKQL